ncbi:MAG: hypothetical protein K8S55_02645 [Phycisphaerae bacterium]|nr:hypothetical protein [Phycisphaerae bacterium]
MRYQETGAVHKDFHGVVNCTIEYICKNFGKNTMHEIFFKTGRDVYKDIREHLAKGDSSELENFWIYFLDREDGEFDMEKNNGEIKLIVKKCPAMEHLKMLEIEPHPEFCSQTEYMNKGLCHGTGFEIKTVKTGKFSCVQTLRRKS